jgi:phage shock protein A
MNDSGHREQKDVKQLQQSLTECGRELDKEKADRKKAIERFNDLKEKFNKLQTDKNELQMRLAFLNR